MRSAPITFRFPDGRSALLAFDTLQELGFHVELLEEGHSRHPQLQVNVEKGDLTSALEIVQAHGGNLKETQDSGTESEVFDSAYGLDGIPIPAHTVTEDLAEEYLHSGAHPDAESGHEEYFEPSAEDYDRFPAGIRL